MGHAICRLSEVIYRISLLSLFWTVCGGEAFAVLMAVEFLTLCFFVCGYDLTHDGLTMDDAYLRFQQLIIMPSELVYALQGRNIDLPTNDMPCIFRCCVFLWCGGICCGSCFCCAGAAVLFSTCCLLREEWYVHMTIRIGVSMLEWTILIIWGSVDDKKYHYLFSANHGLSIFIISFICYFTYTQYMTLFPNFKLPHGIPIRSKWGYAFNGELEELKRFKKQTIESNGIAKWNDDDPTESEINFNGVPNPMWYAFYGNLEKLKEWKYDGKTQERTLMIMLALSNKQYDIVEYLETELKLDEHKKIFENQDEFENMDYIFGREYLLLPFNQPYKSSEANCILLALSNKQYHVVEWMIQEKQVMLPKEEFIEQMDFEIAREYVGPSYFHIESDKDK